MLGGSAHAARTPNKQSMPIKADRIDAKITPGEAARRRIDEDEQQPPTWRDRATCPHGPRPHLVEPVIRSNHLLSCPNHRAPRSGDRYMEKPTDDVAGCPRCGRYADMDVLSATSSGTKLALRSRVSAPLQRHRRFPCLSNRGTFLPRSNSRLASPDPPVSLKTKDMSRQPTQAMPPGTTWQPARVCPRHRSAQAGPEPRDHRRGCHR